MNVRKLVILGENDVVKNRLIRSLLGLQHDDNVFPGVDRYRAAVQVDHGDTKLEILNITGDSRYKSLASQNIVGAEYVWLVLSADEKSFDKLHEWYRSADLLAYGAEPMVIVWQEAERASSLSQEDLYAFLARIGLQKSCGTWVRSDSQVKFEGVFAKYFSDEYQAMPKPIPAFRLRVASEVSHHPLLNFLRHRARFVVALPLFILGLSVAAYFAWPLLLASASTYLLGTNAALVMLSIAMPVAVLLFSAVSAFAFEKTSEAFSGQCNQTTANILRKFDLGARGQVAVAESLGQKKDEMLIEESRPLINKDLNSEVIRLRR